MILPKLHSPAFLCSGLQVEIGRLRAELGVISAERAMLEERVSVLGSQLSAGQSNWGTAQRELSQLQVRLPVL